MRHLMSSNLSYESVDKAESERVSRAARFEASQAAGKRDSLANQLHEIANSVEGGDTEMMAWAIGELGRIRAEMELCRLTMNQTAREMAENEPKTRGPDR